MNESGRASSLSGSKDDDGANENRQRCEVQSSKNCNQSLLLPGTGPKLLQEQADSEVEKEPEERESRQRNVDPKSEGEVAVVDFLPAGTPISDTRSRHFSPEQ